LNGGISLADAMRQARVVADAGRAEPGTEAFNALKYTIIKNNNWDHISAVPRVLPPEVPRCGSAAGCTILMRNGT